MYYQVRHIRYVCLSSALNTDTVNTGSPLRLQYQEGHGRRTGEERAQGKVQVVV